MNERLMRTGHTKKIKVGLDNFRYIEEYDIYSADMRTVLDTVWGLADAQRILKDYVLQERTACSNGSCED